MPRQSDMYGHDMTRIEGTGTGLIEIPEGIAIVAPGMITAMSVVAEEMITGGMTGGMTGESAGIAVVIDAVPASNKGKQINNNAYPPLDLIS